MGRHRLGPPSAPEAEPPTDSLEQAMETLEGCPVRADTAGKQRARPPGMVALRASLDFPNPRGPGAGTTRRPVVAPAHQGALHRPGDGPPTRCSTWTGSCGCPEPGTTGSQESAGPSRSSARGSQALHTPRLPRPYTGGFSDLDPATGQDRTTEARTEPPGDQR